MKRTFGLVESVCAVVSILAALFSLACAFGFIPISNKLIDKPTPASVAVPALAPSPPKQEDLTGVNTDYETRDLSGQVKFRPVLYAYKSGEHIGEFTTWKTVEVHTDLPGVEFGNKRQVAVYKLEKIVTVEPTVKEVTK